MKPSSFVTQTLCIYSGGCSDKYGPISNQVMMYDADLMEWKAEEPLPVEIGDGLSRHCAVKIDVDNDAKVTTIVCVGGYVAASLTTHPRQMVVFDVSC